MAHCFSALAVLLAGTAVVQHNVGLGAGPIYAGGLQSVPGGYLSLDNEPFPIGTPTAVAAGTPTVVYTMHAPVSSEITDYAVTCTIRYTDADAGQTLDGGVGEWTFHQHVVGGFHGGAFCAQNPAGGADICTTGAALSGIGSYSLDPVPGPDSGLQAGATCGFGWSGSALTVVANPGIVSYAFGWITGQRVKDPGAPASVDSGVDASDSGTDAADASDAGDSGIDGGPAPTMSLVTPNSDSARGGVTVTSTIGNCGLTTPTVTVGGTSATGISCTGGVLTFTNPAYSTNAGTNTNQTITVTTSQGSVSSSTTANSMRYSAATECGFSARFRGDSLAGGTWTTWPDISGNGHSMRSVNGSATTTVNSLVAPTFNGSTTYAIQSDTTAICALLGDGGAPEVTIVAAAESSSYAGGPAGVVALTAGNAADGGLAASGFSTQIQNYSNTSYASDRTNNITGIALTNADAYGLGVISNGASSYLLTTTTLSSATTLGQQTTFGPLLVGAIASGSSITYVWSGPVMEVTVQCCALNTTELQEAVNVMRTTWSTQ